MKDMTTSDFDRLIQDEALKSVLSKEVKNDSNEFEDYAPTSALVRAAVSEAMELLGIVDD